MSWKSRAVPVESSSGGSWKDRAVSVSGEKDLPGEPSAWDVHEGRTAFTETTPDLILQAFGLSEAPPRAYQKQIAETAKSAGTTPEALQKNINDVNTQQAGFETLIGGGAPVVQGLESIPGLVRGIRSGTASLAPVVKEGVALAGGATGAYQGYKRGGIPGMVEGAIAGYTVPKYLLANAAKGTKTGRAAIETAPIAEEAAVMRGRTPVAQPVIESPPPLPQQTAPQDLPTISGPPPLPQLAVEAAQFPKPPALPVQAPPQPTAGGTSPRLMQLRQAKNADALRRQGEYGEKLKAYMENPQASAGYNKVQQAYQKGKAEGISESIEQQKTNPAYNTALRKQRESGNADY